MYLCRFANGAGPRVGFIHRGGLYDITEGWGTMSDLLAWSVGRGAQLGTLLAKHIVGAAPLAQIDDDGRADAPGMTILRPTDAQEIWAAGVTYERSRVAREEESGGSGVYDRVYTAPRPEIFFKATPHRAVGPGEPIAVRRDSAWNVPEPELGLVLNQALEIVGYTIGNDVSSRDIEGENPLYLPQAKVYGSCCALGPRIALAEQIADPKALTIRLHIARGGAQIFAGEIGTGKIVRSFAELTEYLGRDNSFPDGAVLLTGTGIVPPDAISIDDGDTVTIAIGGIGALVNPVVRGAGR